VRILPRSGFVQLYVQADAGTVSSLALAVRPARLNMALAPISSWQRSVMEETSIGMTSFMLIGGRSHNYRHALEILNPVLEELEKVYPISDDEKALLESGSSSPTASIGDPDLILGIYAFVSLLAPAAFGIFYREFLQSHVANAVSKVIAGKLCAVSLIVRDRRKKAWAVVVFAGDSPEMVDASERQLCTGMAFADTHTFSGDSNIALVLIVNGEIQPLVEKFKSISECMEVIRHLNPIRNPNFVRGG